MTAAARAAAGRPTVLVIEDEALVRDMIVEFLEESGFVVVAAETGEEGLRRLEAGTERVDLVFTDIRLPGAVDGWQLAERARTLRPGIPILYATGYSVEQPRQVPGSRLLAKPYRLDAVLEALQELGAGRG
ncbi:MAG TPA: response regulator [Alphaproteobacteria bacterium]|nr:response regulator [Alphaproteobacteria bacterium]